MDREETKEAIKVMQAWVDGRTDIQFRYRGSSKWTGFVGNAPALWDWCANEYRIKPQPVEVTCWAIIKDGGVIGTSLSHCDALEYANRKGAFVVKTTGTYTEGE